MASTAPTRIDRDLYESAQRVAAEFSRSATQQLNHWARVGRALEASDHVSVAAIRAVLEGSGDYDELNDEGQAIVRARWSERAEALREGLDFTAEFAVSGRSYVELDDDGNVVEHSATEPAAG